jgi:uncharacterized DUF497 family protein
VEFEWDEAKSERNRRERGLPFDVAMALFDGPTVERRDRRRDYGEQRTIATGAAEDRILTCVYVDRHQDSGMVRRIISLRPASRKERRDYGDHTKAS